MTKQDFQYESDDINRIKVSFKELEHDDKIGFRVGLVTSFLTYYFTRNTNRYNRLGLGLLTGSLAYTFWTNKSQQRYDFIAGEINKKYSQKLNLLMEY